MKQTLTCADLFDAGRIDLAIDMPLLSMLLGVSCDAKGCVVLFCLPLNQGLSVQLMNRVSAHIL